MPNDGQVDGHCHQHLGKEGVQRPAVHLKEEEEEEEEEDRD